MNEEQTTNQPEASTTIQPTSNDWTLELILSTLHAITYDGSTFSFDITLHVQGAILCGKVITAKEYFEKLKEDWKEGLIRFYGEDSDFINDIADVVSNKRTFEENFSNEPPTTFDYIHLENVIMVTPNGSLNTPLWRGKLSSVDGYSIGGFRS